MISRQSLWPLDNEAGQTTKYEWSFFTNCPLYQASIYCETGQLCTEWQWLYLHLLLGCHWYHQHLDVLMVKQSTPRVLILKVAICVLRRARPLCSRRSSGGRTSPPPSAGMFNQYTAHKPKRPPPIYQNHGNMKNFLCLLQILGFPLSVQAVH